MLGVVCHFGLVAGFASKSRIPSIQGISSFGLSNRKLTLASFDLSGLVSVFSRLKLVLNEAIIFFSAAHPIGWCFQSIAYVACCTPTLLRSVPMRTRIFLRLTLLLLADTLSRRYTPRVVLSSDKNSVSTVTYHIYYFLEMVCYYVNYLLAYFYLLYYFFALFLYITVYNPVLPYKIFFSLHIREWVYMNEI